MHNFKDIIEKTKDELLPVLLSVLGCSGKFTEEGLVESENRINEIYPFGHQPLETTLFPFGVQLGQTLVENIPGASWNYEAETLSEVSVSIPTNGKLGPIISLPFVRISKFWFEDRDYTFSNLYRCMKFLSDLDFNNKEYLQKIINDEGKITFPNGDEITISVGFLIPSL